MTGRPKIRSSPSPSSFITCRKGFIYAARVGEFSRVLPRVLALRTDPPLRGADAAFVAAVTNERKRLLGFYEAGLHAYNGQRQLWVRALERVLSEDGDNPYYRWIVGGKDK